MNYFYYWFVYIQEHGDFHPDCELWTLRVADQYHQVDIAYEAWSIGKINIKVPILINGRKNIFIEREHDYIAVTAKTFLPYKVWDEKTFDKYDEYMLWLEKVSVPMAMIIVR